MPIENYHLEGGLSDEQIEVMKEKALDLVEKVGIHVPHEGILKLLSDYDGVSIENQEVKFKSDLVLKALKEAKYPVPDYAENNWIVSAGAHQTKIFDLDTGAIRDTTLNDLVEMIKLVRMLIFLRNLKGQ